MPSARKISTYQKSKKAVNKSLLNTKYVKVTQKNFGWAEMELTNKRTGKVEIFKIRPSLVKQAKEEAKGSMFKTPQGVLYSKWINTTKKGQLYSDRRQVEGILKVAYDTRNHDLIAKVEEVLKHSDAFVSNWYRNTWLQQMNDSDLNIFYEGSDDTIESELAGMGIIIED